MLNRRIIALTVFIVALAFIWLIVDGLRQIGVNQGYEPDQPIAFSHKIHAGDNGIDCLYCHFGAEKSRHAGIPPANVCLNCHTEIRKDSPEIAKVKKAVEEGKPIEWNKVHRMPDFVYFNHAQHVAVAKLDCQSCHGPVETMTRMRQDASLSMGWCLDCHRSRDVTVKGHEGKLKASERGGQDCAKCHY